MSDLKAAEAALLALESHGHAVADARSAVCRAEFTGEPKIIEAAKADLAKAEADEKAAGIDPLDISKAAELVLALRGEQHTELGVLPPNHGIKTVMAERGLAEARRLELFEGKKGLIAEAEKVLADAIADDKATKEAHMNESADRAINEHQGA